MAKTTPKKKRRVELRVADGEKRIKWSKKHGRDTYFYCSGDSDFEEMVCDSGDGVNQNKGKGKGSGRGKPQGRGSVLHVDRAHTDAPATETALSTKFVPKKTTTLMVPQRN